MKSIVEGYEYDIFISYRQKDNKYDGWVTEFVNNLRKELEATFKEDISIYFDENPSDGILETYDVDKSLEGKLKSLIFIPVISQTYCDPKSFAWQNEFIAFNKASGNDSFGSKIKLSNGNVTGRILPVKIHDLDPTDKTLLESELGGLVRAVEFIYKAPGVNRPLKSDDSKTENLNHTYYRDQINKVANAVKEIITALSSHTDGQNDHNVRNLNSKSKDGHKGSKKFNLKIAIWSFLILVLAVSSSLLIPILSKTSSDDVDKSIAVLPFENLSNDPDMEFLGNGFAESIGTALDEIKGLKVIGRRSSFQFKGENTDLRDIGQKLHVSTLLGGSIQVSGNNNLRITVKLINAKDRSDIWAQDFTRIYTMDNLYAIQDEITKYIVKRFKMNSVENLTSTTDEPPTKNKEAYEMVSQGKFFLNQGPEGGKKAVKFFQNAIKIDSGYAEAYLGLSKSYFFTGEKIKMKEALDKAHKLNANEGEYLGILIAYYYVYDWNWEGVRIEHEKWLKYNSPGHTAYAWYLASLYRNFNDAIREMEMSVEKDPLNEDGIRNLATFYIMNKQYNEARRNLSKIIETKPYYALTYERLGYSYYCEGDYKKAIEYYEKSNSLSSQLSSKIEIVIAMAHSGQKVQANKILIQLIKENESKKQGLFSIGVSPGGGNSASIAMAYFSLGEPDNAFKWLNKAYEDREGLLIGLKIDPIYDPFRKDPRFIRLYKKMNFPD